MLATLLVGFIALALQSEAVYYPYGQTCPGGCRAPPYYQPQTAQPVYYPGAYQPQKAEPVYYPGAYQPQKAEPVYYPGAYQPQKAEPVYYPGAYQPQKAQPVYYPGAYQGYPTFEDRQSAYRENFYGGCIPGTHRARNETCITCPKGFRFDYLHKDCMEEVL